MSSVCGSSSSCSSSLPSSMLVGNGIGIGSGSGSDTSSSDSSSSSSNSSSIDTVSADGSSCNRIVVAVDLDEVLGQFLQALIRYYNATLKKDKELKFEDFHSYNFHEVWGGTAAEATHLCHDFFETKYFLEELHVLPGALEMLLKLKHTNKYKFVVVTSRQHVVAAHTRLWLDKHYPGIFDDVQFGNHFAKHGGAVLSKPQMCQAIGARALIDDSLKYALEVSQAIEQVFLFDWDDRYGWNKTQEPLPANVTRVKDWDKVYDLLTNHFKW